MRNAPLLITYADRFAGDLRGIAQMLNGPLAGAFGGVHVLPFYERIDGADAGFDPEDHTRVDARIGTWDDVAAISQTHEVMADLIINHVSSDSEAFRDWLANGAESPYDGMFCTYEGVFGEGATNDELCAVYRPRPGMPFTKFFDHRGRQILLWTTFTSAQIDIDVEGPQGTAYLDRVVDALANGGVTLVRLDAVGYAIKRRGTSCFMIPETYEFIADFADRCRARGMEVLVEIHGYYQSQIEVASRVDLVYDFGLPPLVLDAFFTGDTTVLRRWIDIRPTNCMTVLDTHDGIGVIDVATDVTDRAQPGLLSDERVVGLVDGISRRSGGTSGLATGAAAANLDIYQVNCTYYDALGRDDQQYLMARLLQFLLPGVPQVYYMGLLAGTNDIDLLTATGVGRDINRRYYDPHSLSEALTRPVVRRLVGLLRWRASTTIFDGTFTHLDAPPGRVAMRWSADGQVLDAELDIAATTFRMVDVDGTVIDDFAYFDGWS
jgi:sucrose phosphorylase